LQYDNIIEESQLLELCERLASAKRIGFDTEFVSEFTYRPDLCLIQVEYDGRLAVIDTKAVENVKPFWQVLVDGEHETICHAGREEFRFCVYDVEKAPKDWFDVQLAAGMIGLEYPISYGKLLQRLLKKRLPKGETRTDWRRRPLTKAQLEYALEDVIHLPRLCDIIKERLEELGRLSWYETEAIAWQDNVREAETRERWRKISGTSGLPPRTLAVVKELWRWRDSEARHRNTPAKRVLRDDLIVELAKRGNADPTKIRDIRGIQRRDLNDQYENIAAAIQTGLDAPPIKKERIDRSGYPSQLNLLSQFLGTALNSICRKQSIAVSLVGTTQDVRDLIAHHLGYGKKTEVPALASGWRAEVVGNDIEKLLKGELSLRITDPHDDAPLSFEEN